MSTLDFLKAQVGRVEDMKTRVQGLAAALLSGALLAGGFADAHPITQSLEGTVNQSQFDPFDPLGGALGPGSHLSAYLTFDTEAIDSSASPDIGSYTFSGGPYGVATRVDGIAFPPMSTVNISLVNGAGSGPDQYSVFAWEGSADGLGDFFSLSVLLQDDTGTVFDGVEWPATWPALDRFHVRSFFLTGQYTDPDGQFIQYEIQGDIALAAVPEPAVLTLASLALLCGLGASRRPRTRPVA